MRGSPASRTATRMPSDSVFSVVILNSRTLTDWANPRKFTLGLLRVKTGKALCEHMFSALPLRADCARDSRHVHFVPILLKKYSLADQRNFSALLVLPRAALASACFATERSRSVDPLDRTIRQNRFQRLGLPTPPYAIYYGAIVGIQIF
jgi:hypothetical protein